MKSIEEQFEAVRQLRSAGNITEEEYQQMIDIINNSQEGEVKISTTTDQTENWKRVRNGLIIFTILHLLLEVSIGDPQTVGISVAFNFFVARWYLKRQINKGVHKDNFALFGFLIALAVFGIRFFLGVSLILLLQ